MEAAVSVADVLDGRTGWHLIEGDCLSPDVGLPSLPDGCAQHVITDPPYGARTHDGARTLRHTRKLVDFDCIDADGLRRVLSEVGRLAQRWIVATVEWRHIGPIEEVPPAGLRFVRFGVWVYGFSDGAVG
jgi:site-specific DNA-methyltransferase (adenine-specific)